MELSYKKKGTSTPGEGEERFPHSEKPSHGEISWDRKGPLVNQRKMQWMV